MLPMRISNPFMNKLLSSILIHDLRCPLPQLPQDLLVCLKRFPFLHNFLDVFILTFYLSTSFTSVCLLLTGFSLTSRLTYISHLDCIFTYTLLTMFFTLHIPHRYVLCLFIDFSKPSLSTFNWF